MGAGTSMDRGCDVQIMELIS